MTEAEVYNAIGEDGFSRMVAGFYARVRTDDLIGPMYPADDWEGSERRLRMFLIQRFGGPTTYSQERGHPRLRMRHMPFSIGEAERDRWLTLMRDAIREAQIDEDARKAMWPVMVHIANLMMNRE